MSDNRKFWDVKISFYINYDGDARPTFSETTAHIGFDKAPTALDAIRLCAEWRGVPPPSDWCAIDCTLRASGDYGFITQRPWSPNWESK